MSQWEQYGIVCRSFFMDTLLKAYDDLVGGALTFQFPSGNIHSLECGVFTIGGSC